jgi:hypothetical protein
MTKTNSAFQFDLGQSSEALPSDFLDPISFVPWGWGNPLYYCHEEALRPVRDASGVMQSGTPSQWTVVGAEARVDVACDANFAGDLSTSRSPRRFRLAIPPIF